MKPLDLFVDLPSCLQSSDSIIVVTGATGWVGSSVLYELARYLPYLSLKSRVLAFASKSKTLELYSCYDSCKITIPVYPLAQMPSLLRDKSVLLIHAAFLTKDRISKVGVESFTEINQLITETVCRSIDLVKTYRIISISSGAALEYQKSMHHGSGTAPFDLYGHLKFREESLLMDRGNTQVLRIFGLSGQFIRDPSFFALGDFLLNALQGKRVLVRARSPVIRGYVNAGDVASASLSWLLAGTSPEPPISAVSEIITLASLAKLIANLFDLEDPEIGEMTDPPNSYSDSPVRFLGLCRAYNLVPLSMTDQIKDTARGLKS